MHGRIATASASTTLLGVLVTARFLTATIATAPTTRGVRSGGGHEALQPGVEQIDAQAQHRAQTLKQRWAGLGGRGRIAGRHRLTGKRKGRRARSERTRE